MGGVRVREDIVEGGKEEETKREKCGREGERR